MSVYIVKNCLNSNLEYLVDFGSNPVNVRDVWSFSSITPSVEIFCGVVEGEVFDTPQYVAITQHDDCCDCLIDNGFQSLQFLECDNLTEYLVSTSIFCTGNNGNPPQTNFIYAFFTDPKICATFVKPSTSDPNTSMTPYPGGFGDCTACNNKWEGVDCLSGSLITLDFSFNYAVDNSQVWSTVVEGNNICLTSLNLINSPTGLTPNEQLINCYECLIAFGYQSLVFQSCISSQTFLVDIVSFNSFFGLPTFNKIYEIYLKNSNNETFFNCFSFLGASLDPPTHTVNGPVTEYNYLCSECTQPKSANTESTVCVICSGNTFTVSPPHPVWTDNKGKAVIQLDAITLGGNGLNS